MRMKKPPEQWTYCTPSGVFVSLKSKPMGRNPNLDRQLTVVTSMDLAWPSV